MQVTLFVHNYKIILLSVSPWDLSSDKWQLAALSVKPKTLLKHSHLHSLLPCLPLPLTISSVTLSLMLVFRLLWSSEESDWPFDEGGNLQLVSLIDLCHIATGCLHERKPSEIIWPVFPAHILVVWRVGFLLNGGWGLLCFWQILLKA